MTYWVNIHTFLKRPILELSMFVGTSQSKIFPKEMQKNSCPLELGLFLVSCSKTFSIFPISQETSIRASKL